MELHQKKRKHTQLDLMIIIAVIIVEKLTFHIDNLRGFYLKLSLY